MNEIESTLVVCSTEPSQVLKRIAELDSISGFRLLPQSTQIIRDVYIDLPDGALASKKAGLRVREVDGRRLITLKGPAKLSESAVSERLEIELEWSADGLTEIVQELGRWGIEIERPYQDLGTGRPHDVLSKLGFQAIQRRENSRQRRNVVRKGAVGTVLAEMAIDSLTFNFEGQRAHHQEVEIEAKSREGADALVGLTEDLKGRFPSDLAEWTHGKLATGLAVERMAEAGELNAVLDRHGNLMPVAYEKIDSYLRTISL